MRPLPGWTVPLAFFLGVLVLLGALFAIGDGSKPGDHANEVAAAHRLLREEDHYIEWGEDGQWLVDKGERECREASYLCNGPARWNVETGSTKLQSAIEQIKSIRAALRQLDRAAVEEAER
jgi:hypothetical protein